MKLASFRAFTFDCYGTLIDWETGMLGALREWADAKGIDADDDSLLSSFARHEHVFEEIRPALLYSEVLRRVFKAIAEEHGRHATDRDAELFAESIATWPPFPDSVKALAYLREHAMLVVLSNVDRASFAHSASLLGNPFHAVITAEDVRSYKPAPPHFGRAVALFAEHGIKPHQVMHVAQSLFHDIPPARTVGFATCWIDRRGGRGGGATPASDETPDLTLPDLATLVEMRRAEKG
ncbi:MAG: haloacid dehalogenase type II [Sphingomonadales bacterium]|nr:haloacid dehalogenase type II [Sphingomonadales bacterium]